MADDPLRRLVASDRDHACDGFGAARVCVKLVAVAELPTRFGHFRIVAFRDARDGKEHVAMVHGEVAGAEEVPVRIHSECLTGDVMGSLRCDCRDQLVEGLAAVRRHDRGLLLYLRQAGSDTGLVDRLRAYDLQDRGLVTAEPGPALRFRDDERDHALAAHMLRSLEVRSIRLVTSDPAQVRRLTQHGIAVVDHIAHVLAPNEFNRRRDAPAVRPDRHRDARGGGRLPEQGDPPVVAAWPSPDGDEPA